MNDIFGDKKVAAINAVGKKVRLVVEGLKDETIWITSVRGEIEPNFQLMYSIGAQIYINTFQHKLSAFTLGGVYVFDLCGQEAGGTPPFLSFYLRNNIAVSDRPIKVSFNGIVVTGYIVKLVIGEFNQDNIEGHEFSMPFLGIVEGTGAGGTQAAGRLSGTGARLTPAGSFSGARFGRGLGGIRSRL